MRRQVPGPILLLSPYCPCRHVELAPEATDPSFRAFAALSGTSAWPGCRPDEGCPMPRRFSAPLACFTLLPILAALSLPPDPLTVIPPLLPVSRHDSAQFWQARF